METIITNISSMWEAHKKNVEFNARIAQGYTFCVFGDYHDVLDNCGYGMITGNAHLFSTRTEAENYLDKINGLHAEPQVFELTYVENEKEHYEREVKCSILHSKQRENYCKEREVNKAIGTCKGKITRAKKNGNLEEIAKNEKEIKKLLATIEKIKMEHKELIEMETVLRDKAY